MHKTKRSRFVVVAIVIFSMVAMYGYMPVADAANMWQARITLGDSAPNATATSTVTFNLATTTLPADGYIRVDFTGTDFGSPITVAQVDCEGGTATTTGLVVDCQYAAGLDSNDHTIDIQLTNGATGVKNIEITAYEDDYTEIESSNVAVYIIDSVTVSATVNATLAFTLSGTSTGAVINGATTTVDTSSAADAVPFGALNPDTVYTAGQDLTVETNAGSGFTVTVEQNNDLTSGGGETIDAFVDGTPSGGATWTSPGGTLGNFNEYGHMGLTGSDAGLASVSYVGLLAGSPTTVMSHGGPADGVSAGVGYASVAYSIEVSALQQAGDYENRLTYVCTPIY